MCRIEVTNLGGEDCRDEEEERGEGIHIVGMSEDSRKLMDSIFIQCSAWLCSSGKPRLKKVHQPIRVYAAHTGFKNPFDARSSLPDDHNRITSATHTLTYIGIVSLYLNHHMLHGHRKDLRENWPSVLDTH